MTSNELINLVEKFLARHPAAKARDLYKMLYHKNFGPSHILEDLIGAKDNFLKEFDNNKATDGFIFESIDEKGRVFWLHLRQAKAADISPEHIWNVVIRSSTQFIDEKDDFRFEWMKVSNFFKSMDLDDDDITELDAYANYDVPPVVHHSNEFVHSEKPSYRVVTGEAVVEKGGKLAEVFAEERERMLQQNYAQMVKTQTRDVQKDRPKHAVDINRVGISDLEYPVSVLDKNRAHQETVAKVTMSVDLPARWRGTHMSRFLGVLNKHRGEITYVQIRAILEAMRGQFEAKAAHFTMEFPYFVEKAAPVTGERAYMSYQAVMDGELDREGFRFRVGVHVPITTLCPCSKELCDRSAHSQRALVEISVLSPSFIWLEELIELAEGAASSPVFSLLKRPDEKFVTDEAYANPRFVEDVARHVAKELDYRRDIAEYLVRVVSEESIHNHDAFATIEGGFGERAFEDYYSSLDDDAYSTNF